MQGGVGYCLCLYDRAGMFSDCTLVGSLGSALSCGSLANLLLPAGHCLSSRLFPTKISSSKCPRRWLENAVTGVQQAASAHLLQHLHRAHGLERHLLALKHHMLMGRGDFVSALLDLAEPELDKPARQVSQYVLQVMRIMGGTFGWRGGAPEGLASGGLGPRMGKGGCDEPSAIIFIGAERHRSMHPCLPARHGAQSGIHSLPTTRRQGHLDAALRASTASSQDTDVADRLTVRLARALEGDSGWDVFSLQYAVDGALAAVLAPSAMACEAGGGDLVMGAGCKGGCGVAGVGQPGGGDEGRGLAACPRPNYPLPSPGVPPGAKCFTFRMNLRNGSCKPRTVCLHPTPYPPPPPCHSLPPGLPPALDDQAGGKGARPCLGAPQRRRARHGHAASSGEGARR